MHRALFLHMLLWHKDIFTYFIINYFNFIFPTIIRVDRNVIGLNCLSMVRSDVAFSLILFCHYACHLSVYEVFYSQIRLPARCMQVVVDMYILNLQV